MHLCLIDRPVVSHYLISTQENPVPLLKFQMAPRLKILMSSGSKEETQTYSFFLSKIQANKQPPPPPRFPITAPMEIDIHLQGNCIYLENLTNIPLDKEALMKKAPLPQKRGTCGSRHPFPSLT
jgi:hypothetical protein